MLKILRLTGLIAILIAVVLVAGNEFPKYAVRMAYFSVFLLVDILCWKAFRQAFEDGYGIFRALCAFIYWFPFALLVVFVMTVLIIPMHFWLPFFRIYVPGVLVVAYIGKIILILMMLAGELIKLPSNISSYLYSRRYKLTNVWSRSGKWIKTSLAFSVLVMLLFITGMVHWVYDFKVKEVIMAVDEIPPSFNGMKIVQISDLHLGSWRSPDRLNEAVSLIMEQNADLIAFTGDMVNFSSAETLAFAAVLRKLKAPMGVYAIKGNHDYGDYISWNTPADKEKNLRDLNAFYKSIGWKLLDNAHLVLVRGSDTIILAGVENWSASKLYGKRGNLNKALIGTGTRGFKILLSHDPTHWNAEVVRNFPDIDLTLSGHTHAMQIGWERSGSRWSPAQWKYKEWAGLYYHHGSTSQYLYVNRGLGHIAYPGRIGIRPEITVIQLVKG